MSLQAERAGPPEALRNRPRPLRNRPRPLRNRPRPLRDRMVWSETALWPCPKDRPYALHLSLNGLSARLCEACFLRAVKLNGQDPPEALQNHPKRSETARGRSIPPGRLVPPKAAPRALGAVSDHRAPAPRPPHAPRSARGRYGAHGGMHRRRPPRNREVRHRTASARFQTAQAAPIPPAAAPERTASRTAQWPRRDRAARSQTAVRRIADA